MKNVPGTVKAFAATGLVILTIVVVQACAQHSVSNGYGKNFGLVFETRQQVKDPESFCNLLQKDLGSSAIYNFEIVHDDGKTDSCCKPSDCSVGKVALKVDKITTAGIAEASASELTAIGSHVTQRIYSNANEDIALVLGQAKAQSP